MCVLSTLQLPHLDHFTRRNSPHPTRYPWEGWDRVFHPEFATVALVRLIPRHSRKAVEAPAFAGALYLQTRQLPSAFRPPRETKSQPCLRRPLGRALCVCSGRCLAKDASHVPAALSHVSSCSPWSRIGQLLKGIDRSYVGVDASALWLSLLSPRFEPPPEAPAPGEPVE